jgi:hypothetical protein
LELEHMYGDYNVLPPKNKQVVHMIKAWKLKKPVNRFLGKDGNSK